MQKQKRINKKLDLKHVNSIKNICKENELLTYTFFTSIADILLYKVYGKETVKVLSPRYMAETEEVKSQLIFIENTIHPDESFRKFINEVKNSIVNSYKRQNFIHYDNQSKKELFKKKSIVLSYNQIHKASVNDIMVSEMQNELVVCIEKTPDEIDLSIYYNCESYQEETIESLYSSYCYIIEQIIENMDISIDDIDMVDPEQEEVIINQYSQTSSQKNQYKNIVEMFDDVVAKHCKNIAVSHGNRELTYKELNYEVNRISTAIVKLNLEPNSVIAIIADYSIEMVIAILAVLRTRNAYLPVDVNCPKQRKEYMLIDSGVNAVVMASRDEELQLKNIKLLNFKEIPQSNDYIECKNSDIGKEDLAYIIYTSGTTGKPKKVLIEHHSVVNLFCWRNQEYNITSNDKILQLLSFEFDGFGTNLYSALLTGAELVIPDSEKKGNFEYINELIDEKKITNMSLVPSLFGAILTNRQTTINSLKTVILAGEKSNNKIIELAKRWAPNALFINEYGPTENCIVTTYLKNFDNLNSSIIGKPINNVRVYILNKQMQTVPVGVWGELYITGEGLAREFCDSNGEQITRLVDSPFCKGEKLYPTGDYVRWIKEGFIEFKGRIDQQIKIRGYRVELSEIEQTISDFLEIDDVAVICKSDNDNNNLLCAFVVAEASIDMNDLRKQLALLMPDYMVPSRFIHIESMPLTSSGKVSKEKLLELYEKQYMNRTIIMPKNQTEEKIFNIWASVLNNVEISTIDSFFEVGGNSLLLTKVLSMIKGLLGIQLNVTDLFSYPTIVELAHKIDHNDETTKEYVQIKYTKLPMECFNLNVVQEKMKKYFQLVFLY